MFLGGKNHVNDLRSDALKRIRASDNQLITKEHFIRLEADKCQSVGNVYDQSGPVTDFDYSPNAAGSLKEHKSYFMEKSYYNSDQRNRPCDSYGSGGGGGGSIDGSNGNIGSISNANDKNNHSHHENDFDESISMNGDNYLVSSSGNVSNTDNNRLNSTTHRNAKRKHAKDDSNAEGDNNSVFHKMYKNNCGDIMQSKFEYLSSFDGIRPRNIDEMQNDDHHRMVDGSDNDYRSMSGDLNANRGVGGGNGSSDDGATNINVNYASSDDLNQTNTSEHDDKNLSGSDDESGGKYINCSFSIIVLL